MHTKGRRISSMLTLIALITVPAFSQVNTYSPYTRFGLGDLSQGGFGQNLAMGGAGIAIHEDNSLNYLNPAAYSARDSMSVLFDFGLNTYRNHYRTETMSSTWWNANFHHIALSTPVGKHFAMGTGLVPYSSVGYKIKQQYDGLGTGDAIDYYFRGDGGILKYFLGISAKLFNRVSAGVNMNYLLGDINRTRSITFPRNRGFAETESLEEINIRHLYFGFGMQYKEVIGEKFYVSLGATYDMQANLSSAFRSTVTNHFPGTYGLLNDSTILYADYDIKNDQSQESIIIPARIGAGIALGIPGKLTVTGDLYMQDWTSVDNSSLYTEGFDLAAARSIHGGVEYIPDFEALRGYHKLMSYRLGGYLNDSYVKIGDYQLRDYGITFGVGLPLGKTKSSLNVAFTYGSRGTEEFNLVKENYGILTFSVTLHDLWFYKRKFE